MSHKYQVFVDIESTGFCWMRNDIVSAALVVADNEHNILDKFYDTCKPSFDKFYSDDAEKIHGFTKEESATFQSQQDMCIKMLKFLKPFKDELNVPQLFVSHSLGNFDYKFLHGLFLKNDLQWSLAKIFRSDHQESTIKLGRKAGYKKNGLDVWADRLKIDLKHHDAMSDTLACYEVHKHLKQLP